MKLELELNSSQNTTLINHPENDLGSQDVKKMLRSGISFAKEGNRVEARQMLLGVTEVEPNNETAWLWLASISEYPEELLVFLQNVLKVNPDNERALEWAKQTKSLLSKTFVQRGINAAQNNQKDFAKQCFLQGIVHDSENEMAWLWLASTSESQEEKVSHLQKVLRINPNNETALSSLNAVKGQISQGLLKKASSAAVAGDHDTARQTLNAIMKNSPNIEDAWILKAFLATDFYEKIECYEKALEINPECEAAQAGLASLQLLLPKIPKPAVEEAPKAEEVSVAQEVVETVKEEIVEEVKEEVKEEIKEEISVAQEVKEEIVEEMSVTQEVEQEPVAFDEHFGLEQLVEEPIAEAVEFTQPTEASEQAHPQPESRAFAEEVVLEREQEELSIHETQTGFKENFTEPVASQSRIESIFNYDEVISQEESFAQESQVESVLEFDESSNNPTQELEEEYAQHAAASFGISNEQTDEFQAKDEVSETVLETETEQTLEENVAADSELEDFYTEQSVAEVSQNVVAEESASVDQKTEVRITETYVKEVPKLEIYNSEFFANDGFVLVPQNDPFADHTQETVEFSYSETEGVKEDFQAEKTEEVVVAQETEQIVETQEVETVEQSVETQEVENVEQVVETQEFQEVEQIVEPVQEVFEYASQVSEPTEQVGEIEQQFAEPVQDEQVADAEQFVQTQPVVEEEKYEETAEFDSQEEVVEVVENQFAAPVEEVEQEVETQQFEQVEEVAETQSFEQVEEQFEQPSETAQFEQAEEIAEAQSFEQVGEQIEYVAEEEKVEPVAEVVENVAPEQFKQADHFSEEAIEAVQLNAQNYEAQQTQVKQCPFCAAENEAQSVVCNSCQAMLSLSDLEVLISHNGVNQDLLLQAIEKMEVEKSLRDFNAEELTYLAIANLNAKNLEKGLAYLKDASALNPNDVILTSKIKFLTAHLEELKANKTSTIGKNRTILVVDDSPTVRKLISGKLEKCGHSVLSAVDGMDALAKINEVIPDLILLDITMPRLDGYQVCKLIRNNEMTKDVPIIMISGKDGFFDKVRGRMAGSSGYITKPFGPDTLMKTIESYLN
ncbi:MAG: response regulator [Acidobacteriota bacterium]